MCIRDRSIPRSPPFQSHSATLYGYFVCETLQIYPFFLSLIHISVCRVPCVCGISAPRCSFPRVGIPRGGRAPRPPARNRLPGPPVRRRLRPRWQQQRGRPPARRNLLRSRADISAELLERDRRHSVPLHGRSALTRHAAQRLSLIHISTRWAYASRECSRRP